MHEDLLGYLLGALEPDEMQRVSDWLKDNPEGQAELARLERALKPLEDGFEAIEAPSDDLLARTMAAIPDGIPPVSDDSLHHQHKVTLSDVELSRESMRTGNRWSVMDSIGGLLSVATLLALLLPTIAAGRFESRKTACQDNLRLLGTALMQYVTRDHQRRLPQVNASGPEAFAGVYAIRLNDAGLLPEGNTQWCPSMDTPSFARGNQTTAGKNSPADLAPDSYRLPTATELHELSVNQLQWTQQYAGGHYAYSLGVIGDRGYSSPRYEGRATFAIMADAPIAQQDEFGITSTGYSHGGNGINVLYENGAVRFVCLEAIDSMRDNPFLNHAGAAEAGVNIDDASLAPSFIPPFKMSVQR
ncbi:anti-sigma factor family protein [Rhodopirellula sp. MGV]|uniref:anti-sigma factor family protein n=1 Tax=Rhodopirellula sp. MGV TaxID=2023130 RepID=UPI000B9600BD|nr:hypothetical protein [Rhodopirellula sp. MGV]OYP34541.1 hypothetical protein CGZ80_14195 [Rhodopirellula sp. MGV]PNY36743.1 hypothetical protein C2E31_11555 [Rhodopirellula baltica]